LHAVDRETFAARFREAASTCRTFASQYLEEELPPAMRFRLRLNSSYDGNPLHADEIVFPHDSAPERARQLRSCEADEVVATLYRSDRVPPHRPAPATCRSVLENLLCGRGESNSHNRKITRT
jgi:hypothetical protein